MKKIDFVLAVVVVLIGSFVGYSIALAGTLTSTNVQPASLVAGTTNQVTVNFSTIEVIPPGGKVKVTFGSGFNVAGANGGICPTFLGDGGITGFTTTVVDQVVTIARKAGTATTATDAETCTIEGIVNPVSAGSTGTYTITTTNPSDVLIDNDVAVTADIITNPANITIASAKITSSNTVLVTLVNPVEDINSVDFTRWHIDQNNTGDAILNPSSPATITSAGTPWTITLTFPPGSFSDTSKSYDAAHGLYVDNAGVTDTAGDTNVVVLYSDDSIPITDGQKPTPVSATFYDTTGDGKLDRAIVLWSELLSTTGIADDWNITSASDFSNLSEGIIGCNNGGGEAVNECRYNFTTDTIKTDVGDLTLAYTAGTSVTDGTNFADSITFTSASTPAFTDGAAPTIVSAKTGNVSGVGLDKVTVFFSENIDVPLTNGLGWTVTGADTGSRTVTANTDPAGTSSVMVLTLSSPFLSENPDATVTYTTGGGLVDTANIGLATGASPNITDGIKPTFVSAKATSDTNIEVTYSEAVTVTDDSSSGSDFTVVLSTSNVDPTKVDLTVSSLGNTAFTSDGLNLASTVVADISPAHNTNANILDQHVSDGQAPSTPTATPVTGTYTGTQSITLASVGSTSIRYTTDGTDPTTCSGGTLYSGGISISSNQTIKARSCDAVGNISPLGTFIYIINSSSGSSGSMPRAVNILALSRECKLGDLFSVTTGKPCPTPSALSIVPAPTSTSCSIYGSTQKLVREKTRGVNAKGVQNAINQIKAITPPLVIDSIIGPLSEAGIKNAQKILFVTVDGIWGPITQQAYELFIKKQCTSL